MTSSLNFEKASIILNRFLIKQLSDFELTVNEYTCSFKENPELGSEQKAISSVCYKLGVPAVRLGNKIITQNTVDSKRLKGDDWELTLTSERTLNCTNLTERKGIESLERKKLEQNLKKRWNKTTVERASEGGLIWWVTGEAGTDKCGEGWEVHRGRKIDVIVDANGKFYLEIDLHHRFYTPWTLEQWLETYPDVPINYVRNTYKDKNKTYLSWRYNNISDQSPKEILVGDLGITLAEYHRKNGATEEEIKNSRVVYVTKANQWRKAQSVPHLSQRLSPSLTMEMLATIAEQADEQNEKSNIQGVFSYIKKT